MDFSFSEEQTLLRNSLSRYLADDYAFEDWRKFTHAAEGRDPAHWRQFAEMGLFAAPLPEAQGGLGGGAIEIMVVMEEFGRALVVEPFVPTVVIGGGFLAESGRRAGRRMAAQDRGRRDCHGVRLCRSARPLQSGRPHHHGEKARRRLCPSRPEIRGAGCALGRSVDRHRAHRRFAARGEGVSVFLVEKNAKGVSCRDYAAMSGLRASDIIFENAPARLIGEEGDGVAVAGDDRGPRHCRASGGSKRRHRHADERHGRICQDPQTIRPAHRQIPGAAASHGGHVYRPGAGAVRQPDGQSETG